MMQASDDGVLAKGGLNNAGPSPGSSDDSKRGKQSGSDAGMQAHGRAHGQAQASQAEAMQRWLSEEPHEEHWNAVSAAAKRGQQ